MAQHVVDDVSDYFSDDVIDKDTEEKELETLVLGGGNGFRKFLFEQHEALGDISSSSKALQVFSDIENVPNSQLFEFDNAVSHVPLATTEKTSQPEDKYDEERDGLAWHDSDDDRLRINLVSDKRLRKLRIAQDEEEISGREYQRRLRQRFLALNPTPKWQKPSQGARKRRQGSEPDSDTDSLLTDEENEVSASPLAEFLRNVTQLSGRGTSGKMRLRPEVIDIQRSRDIPDKHKDQVLSISFHPKFPILLTSSPASVLYLHHLDAAAHPTPNPKLTSVQVRHVDVRRSEFCGPQGDKIFFAGRRRFFHCWDLESGHVDKTSIVIGHQQEHNSMENFRLSPCGRYMGIMVSRSKGGGGNINILNAMTRQWIAAVRLDGRLGLADFAWWQNGNGMTVLSRDGLVGEWSMVRKRFLCLWRDEGCISGTKIAMGGQRGPRELGGDHWVAVGSSNGIVNIYERQTLLQAGSDNFIGAETRPKPKRTFEQLVTGITSMTFSADGQMLAFASREQTDALRIAHLPSCTIYRNWPTAQTPLGRITAIALGPRSDMLAVGNDTGKVRIWDIRH